MPVLFLKTKPEHLAGVIRNQMHALPHRPSRPLSVGDPILIARTATDTMPPAFTHLARFKGLYEDHENKSSEIWGRDWKYIIELFDVTPLNPTFSWQHLQMPTVDYDRIQVCGDLREPDIRTLGELGLWPAIAPFANRGTFDVASPAGAEFVCLNCRDGLYAVRDLCPSGDHQWLPLLRWTTVESAIRTLGEEAVRTILDRQDPLPPWERTARDCAARGLSRNEIAQAQLSHLARLRASGELSQQGEAGSAPPPAPAP